MFLEQGGSIYLLIKPKKIKENMKQCDKSVYKITLS